MHTAGANIETPLTASFQYCVTMSCQRDPDPPIIAK